MSKMNLVSKVQDRLHPVSSVDNLVLANDYLISDGYFSPLLALGNSNRSSTHQLHIISTPPGESSFLDVGSHFFRASTEDGLRSARPSVER